MNHLVFLLKANKCDTSDLSIFFCSFGDVVSDLEVWEQQRHHQSDKNDYSLFDFKLSSSLLSWCVLRFHWLTAGCVTFSVEPCCVDTSMSDNLRTQQRFDISMLMRDDMKGATFLISPSQAEKGTNVTASSNTGA